MADDVIEIMGEDRVLELQGEEKVLEVSMPGLPGPKGDKGDQGDDGEAGDFNGTLDDIPEGVVNKQFTSTYKAKLDNIAAGATVNATDAQLRDRSTHTGQQPASSISDFDTATDARITAQKAQPLGLATLGADGKLPSDQLPALAITNTFVVNSQAAQLALDVQEGDVCVRTDLSKSFIHLSTSLGTMADWQELLTPTDTVISVNGMTGAVTITNITGNAATATALQNPRQINGVAFDGTANITVAVDRVNGSKVTVGTTQPSSPSVGDIWIDTN